MDYDICHQVNGLLKGEILKLKMHQLERLQAKKLKEKEDLVQMIIMAIKAPNSGRIAQVKNKEGESNSFKSTTRTETCR